MRPIGDMRGAFKTAVSNLKLDKDEKKRTVYHIGGVTYTPS